MLRPAPRETVDYHFGPYRFDGRLRRLYKDGEPIVLTPKAVDTLVALMERAGRVVEKDELLSAVWGETFVGEETLAQNISTLRRVLADDPSRPLFIATVPRRGYRFVASVQAVTLQPPGEASGRPPNAQPRRGRLAALVGTAALAAVVGGLVTNWFSATNPPRDSVEFTVPEPPFGRFSSTGGMFSHFARWRVFVVCNHRRERGNFAVAPAARLDGCASTEWHGRGCGSILVARQPKHRLRRGATAEGGRRRIRDRSRHRIAGQLALHGRHVESQKAEFWTASRPTECMWCPPQEARRNASFQLSMRNARAVPPSLSSCRTVDVSSTRLIGSDTSRSGIYVGEIGKPDPQRLLDALSSSMYISPGLLSYARAGNFYVQRFDTARMRVTGTPISLSDSVAYNARTGRVIAAISETGVLVLPRTIHHRTGVGGSRRKAAGCCRAASHLSRFLHRTRRATCCGRASGSAYRHERHMGLRRRPASACDGPSRLGRRANLVRGRRACGLQFEARRPVADLPPARNGGRPGRAAARRRRSSDASRGADRRTSFTLPGERGCRLMSGSSRMEGQRHSLVSAGSIQVTPDYRRTNIGWLMVCPRRLVVPGTRRCT